MKGLNQNIELNIDIDQSSISDFEPPSSTQNDFESSEEDQMFSNKSIDPFIVNFIPEVQEFL